MPTEHLMRWVWQLPNWPQFSWDSSLLTNSLAAARRAQGEASGISQLLDPDMNRAAQWEILSVEGIATSAIEGEHVDPDSIRSSLARRLGLPASRASPTPRSVDGLTEVMLDAARGYQEALTAEKLSAWQAALFPTGRSGLSEIRVGTLRGAEPMRIISGPLERQRVHFVAPPQERLDEEMDRFLRWFNTPPAGLDGLIRAGLAHAWFEIIHPFADGNGRIGRALLDRALAQDERRAIRLYSLSARLMAVRDEYYDALEHLSQGNLDATSWLVWFLNQFTIAVRNGELALGHVLFKARFWVRHAQSPLNNRQRKALNAMLDAGPAGFIGGMTNRKYANLTKTSPATAQRDLAELVKLQCLELSGAGRGARYILPLSV